MTGRWVAPDRLPEAAAEDTLRSLVATVLRLRESLPALMTRALGSVGGDPADLAGVDRPEDDDAKAIADVLRAVRALDEAEATIAGLRPQRPAEPIVEPLRPKACAECGGQRGPFRHGLCNRCRMRARRAS